MAGLDELRKSIECVTPIGEDEWRLVESALRKIKLRKRQFLVQSGQLVHSDYFVLEGCLKAAFSDQEGREHILQFATEGWWISDYPSLFKGVESRITIDCLENCELAVLPNDVRKKLYDQVPAIKTYFLVKLSNRMVALQNRILSLLMHHPRERYEEFSRLYPHLLTRIPKKYIAQFLGVSRETLSRLHVS